MSHGGSRVGNNDPEAILANAQEIPELGPSELIEFYKLNKDIVDRLGLRTDLFTPSNSEAVTAFSDGIQTRHPAQHDKIEVIDILSNNGAIYDDEIEDKIELDPLIIELLKVRDVSQNIKTLRLRRSLIAVACLRAMADCPSN